MPEIVKDKKQLEQDIIKFLETHHHAVLATIREDGNPQASGFSYVSEGFNLYFAMDPESIKLENIKRNPNVGVGLYEDQHRFNDIVAVQLGGRCEEVTDADELTRIGVSFGKKWPVIQYPSMMEWAARVAPVPFYKITPFTICYIDWTKTEFNEYQVLKP